MPSTEKGFESTRLGVFALSDLPLTDFNCGIWVKITSILVLLPLFLVDCSQEPPKTAAAVGSTPITREQAIAIVSELPEIKAWTKYVEEKTAGKVRAALMVDPEKPQELAGSKYWSVGFYENQPTHVHRWQTFFVRLDGKEILVDDLITGDYLDLQKWREREKPLERVRESKAL